ncbi:thermonuclease family protein [uncultured Paracoccus sp.]|uniref:thermonuclease family protein n=1 Tax=uncultured Paracoccus sp. TaxID=189685 RepID=UPI003459F2CF
MAGAAPGTAALPQLPRLAELVSDREVQCLAFGWDAYGRITADCEEGGMNLGQALVETGRAWAFNTYSDVFASAEDSARVARVGIWAGESQAPWEYRADKWNREAAAPPKPGCPFKHSRPNAYVSLPKNGI